MFSIAINGGINPMNSHKVKNVFLVVLVFIFLRGISFSEKGPSSNTDTGGVPRTASVEEVLTFLDKLPYDNTTVKEELERRGFDLQGSAVQLTPTIAIFDGDYYYDGAKFVYGAGAGIVETKKDESGEINYLLIGRSATKSRKYPIVTFAFCRVSLDRFKPKERDKSQHLNRKQEDIYVLFSKDAKLQLRGKDNLWEGTLDGKEVIGKLEEKAGIKYFLDQDNIEYNIDEGDHKCSLSPFKDIYFPEDTSYNLFYARISTPNGSISTDSLFYQNDTFFSQGKLIIERAVYLGAPPRLKKSLLQKIKELFKQKTDIQTKTPTTSATFTISGDLANYEGRLVFNLPVFARGTASLFLEEAELHHKK